MPATRDANGRYIKGQTGNPLGRPPLPEVDDLRAVLRHKMRRKLEYFMEAQVRSAVEDNNPTAARIVYDYLFAGDSKKDKLPYEYKTSSARIDAGILIKEKKSELLKELSVLYEKEQQQLSSFGAYGHTHDLMDAVSSEDIFDLDNLPQSTYKRKKNNLCTIHGDISVDGATQHQR